MTKKEIIELVAERTKLNKNLTKAIVECVLDVFIEILANEKRIEVRNFGVFKVKRTPARVGRNPVTKETADVPARNIVQFKAGKYMKELVADGKSETELSTPESAPQQQTLL
ncbi:MAG: HU family DNA-binding protein [Candidatus Hinthialibacter antarcticus]|nr:HU family DNA-binding protein [Candidatus Hinthialibacter antarcticus]